MPTVTKAQVDAAEAAKSRAHTAWQNALTARNNFDVGTKAWYDRDVIVRAKKKEFDKKHTKVSKLRAQYNHQQERK